MVRVVPSTSAERSVSSSGPAGRGLVRRQSSTAEMLAGGAKFKQSGQLKLALRYNDQGADELGQELDRRARDAVQHVEEHVLDLGELIIHRDLSSVILQLRFGTVN